MGKPVDTNSSNPDESLVEGEMLQSKSKVVRKKERLNWKQKIDRGERLNNLEDAQADADFNYRARLRDEKERAEFAAKKAGRLQPSDGGSFSIEEGE